MSTPKPAALVTGGSRGIGAAISKSLALSGYKVYVNTSRSIEAGEKLVSEIRSLEGDASLLPFDVSNSADVDAAFETILTESGPLEVLVNNAGITADSLVLRMKDEDLDKVLNVNLKGSVYCARAAARQMLKARKGSIINITSVVGEMGNPGQAGYCASKAGIIGFTKSLARELASRKIRVNAVSPGFIETEMTGILTQAQKEAMLQSIPLGFFGSPEDVAHLVLFLASDKSRYLTGQILSVNGGMYM